MNEACNSDIVKNSTRLLMQVQRLRWGRSEHNVLINMTSISSRKLFK